MSDIFLDRDGVINYNRTDHVKSWQEFQFLPGALEALALLKQAGWRVFVITNQAVINRGIISHAQLAAIHEQMCEQVRQTGGAIHGVLYCPHRPDENCVCRKPRPGLLQQAAQDYGAQLTGSWLVGDHINDIEAGRQAGCYTTMVLSGRGKVDASLPAEVMLADNLAAAVRQIMAASRANSLPVGRGKQYNHSHYIH